MKKYIFALAPFLGVVVPILSLWSQNFGLTNSSDVLSSVMVAWCAVALLMLLFFFCVGGLIRASVAVSVLVIFFYLYGYIFDVLWAERWFEETNQLRWVLLIIFVVYFGLIFFLIRKTKQVLPFARFIFIVSSLMCSFSSVSLIQKWIASPKNIQVRGAEGVDGGQTKTRTPYLKKETKETPDVYYIILDAYARQDVLKKYFSYDNSAFIDGLRERGFYVADQSSCNYPMTFLSLSSTLNMKYLNQEVAEMVGKYGEASQDHLFFYKMIHDNKVARFFQNHGYRYVTVNTRWGGTERSDIADIEFKIPGIAANSEFLSVLLAPTAARDLLPSVAESHLFAFDSILEASKIQGPTFTFSHLILPHPPYVFDADGKELVNVSLSKQFLNGEGVREPDAYIEQLKYANNRVLSVIDDVLTSSDIPPIIIIQSDHGTCSGIPLSPSGKFSDTDIEFIKERHPILNAWLVPENVKSKLSPGMTSVNTFRLLFSEMFNGDYPLLKDRNFSSFYRAPLGLRESTHILKQAMEKQHLEKNYNLSK